MSATQATRAGHYPGTIATLAAALTLPLAVLLRPSALPLAWTLIPALLAAAAAYSGASRVDDDATAQPDTTDPDAVSARGRWLTTWQRAGVVIGRRIAVWSLLGTITEVLWRAGLHWVSGRTLSVALAPATLGVAVVTAASLLVGGTTARRMYRTVTSAQEAGEPLPLVGPTLISGMIAALAVTGWITTDPSFARPAAVTAGAGTVLYCIVAIAQLQRLRRHGLLTRWRTSRRAMQAEVATHWSAITALLAVVGSLAVAVWWIPPLDRLRGGFSLLAWLTDLHQPPPPPEPGDPVGPLFLVRPEEPSGDGGTLEGMLLVLAGLVLIVAVLRWAWRRRVHLPARPAPRLTELLLRVRRWFSTMIGTVAALLGSSDRPTVSTRAGATPSGVFGGVRRRLRGLARPRDGRTRIVHEYLRLLRQATKHGLERPVSQPPRHYAATLQDRLPEHEADIHTLTELFLEARYSPREVEPRNVDRVRTASRNLVTALRHLDAREGVDPRPPSADADHT